MDVQEPRPLSIPIWLLAALPPLFWAGNFVLARALHADIPPLALSFWRWVGALTLYTVYASWEELFTVILEALETARPPPKGRRLNR